MSLGTLKTERHSPFPFLSCLGPLTPTACRQWSAGQLAHSSEPAAERLGSCCCVSCTFVKQSFALCQWGPSAA